MLKYACFFVLGLSWRIIALSYLKNLHRLGYNSRYVIIAGACDAGKGILSFFQNNPEYGYKCLGIFDDHAKREDRLGSLKDLEAYALKSKVDEIYCSLTSVDPKRVKEIISFANNNFIKVNMLPDFTGMGTTKFTLSFYKAIPVISLRENPLDFGINRTLKRSFDLIFSVLVIITVFSWLFPIIALCIKLTSKGPVFFKQTRSGMNNQPFTLYKFRTMEVNAQAHLLQASKGDSRITDVGRFLRRSSLDELPQFFNVFKGDMSIVGPRPHMLIHTHDFSNQLDNFMLRHFVKSGITGLAQVNGYRGEISEPNQLEKRVYYDLLYIENWSFYFDLKIIIQTAFEVIRMYKKVI